MNIKRRKQFASILLLLCSWCSSVQAFEEIRCKTMDIRNNPMGKTVPKIRKDDNEQKSINLNCTVIEGSFLMSMVNSGNLTQKDFPRFESLREITGSVLFFQVAGLKSLGWIFPNLRSIGGQNLIQHYSFIVYQNPELEELGLNNLRVIRNGGVRMTENPKLCNTKAINWRWLQFGPINDVFVDDSSEISVGEGSIAPCVNMCVPKDETKCLQSEKGVSCWSKNSCQLGCEHDRNGTHTGPGCSDDSWSRCHEECIAGCSISNDPKTCYACAHVIHEGKCMAKCPVHLYSYMDRRCVDKHTCESLEPRKSTGQEDSWKAFNGRCHYHCPDQYEEDPANNKTCRFCGSDCIRKCQGNITIDSLSRAKSLEKCTLIDGNLEIAMRIGMESIAGSELTKAFGRIKIIDGYLQIRLSPSFVNLYMFKNLHTITGRYLYRDKYAVSVYENANLQKLFPPTSKFNITAGYLQFQNNRMLCFDHITSFMESLGRKKEMNEYDQSRNSNGDKAICSESSFDVTVDDVSSSSFRLKWKAFNTTDIDYRKFLGYEIMYKEVEKPDENMSIDDDRSACSDSWNSYFIEVKTSVTEARNVQAEHKDGGEYVKEEIANDMIKPNTYYAFYVATSMVRHEGALNAVSRIGFLRTNFGTPEPPILKMAEERGTNTIYLQWDPPVRPNGEITHYIVTYKPQSVDHFKYMEEYGDGCEGVEDVDGRPRDSNDEEMTTLSPAQHSLLSTIAPADTCAASGCCQCPVDPKTASQQRQETSDFENALQDAIFVQNVEVKRIKRSLDSSPKDKESAINRIEEIEKNIRKYEVLKEPMRINVTGTNITLTNLHHYTTYFISMRACQNTSAEEHYCSHRKAWKNIQTRGIREADLIDNSTIMAEIINGTNSVNITWEPPKSPNGIVRYYEVTVINLDTKTTPVKQCIGHKGGWTPARGLAFHGLTDGTYRVEIRTRSLLPKLSDISFREELFIVYVPGFWTTNMILSITGGFLFVLLILSLVVYHFIRRYYGAKVMEYATQLITANPEYLSQQDVYKSDEWELPRSKLTVENCIGKGTFGQVFKGLGHQLQSVNGCIFGPCAIKTVADGANSTERIHFLLEASVMKKFDAQHIVKLYGVVSDGQPVYVVMELMEHGNLRDYLRSRRPGDETNIHGLSPPTEQDFLLWSLQIADGLSYLESLRFCHRDIAARNCMVSADLVVKIGDFGMTRDLCYKEYYKPAGRRMMPVRWMAPESLVDGRHDIKSDVWSFGIVLYEMWTLGQQPYQGLANDEIIEYIARKRKIIDQPEEAPIWWYTLMTECWRYDPRDRPNFFMLVESLLEKAESFQPPMDLKVFTEVSFAVKNQEFAQAELKEDGIENHYHPEPLRNFLADEMETKSKKKKKRGVDVKTEKAAWGEGDALASNGVAEHEV